MIWYATQSQGNGGRGKFDNNSVLGIPEPIKLRPESNAQDEKPHPRLPTARVGNAKLRSSAKSFSNSNISTNRSAASAAAKDDKSSLNRVSRLGFYRLVSIP